MKYPAKHNLTFSGSNENIYKEITILFFLD